MENDFLISKIKIFTIVKIFIQDLNKREINYI
jgi:hypothetical protein